MEEIHTTTQRLKCNGLPLHDFFGEKTCHPDLPLMRMCCQPFDESGKIANLVL